MGLGWCATAEATTCDGPAESSPYDIASTTLRFDAPPVGLPDALTDAVWRPSETPDVEGCRL